MVCLIFEYFSPFQITFSLEKSILWIVAHILRRGSGLKWKPFNDGFVSYKKSLILTAPIHYKGAIGEQVM